MYSFFFEYCNAGKIWKVKLTKSTNLRQPKYSILERPELLVEPILTTSASTISQMVSLNTLFYDVSD